MFRRLTARQPFYNWELRFSDGEQHPGEGGGEHPGEGGGAHDSCASPPSLSCHESGGDGASEKTDGEGEDIAADQTEAETVDQVGAGGEAVAVVEEQADEVAAGDEAEEDAADQVEEDAGGGGGGGGGNLDSEQARDESEGDALGGRNFKRWVVRLRQLEERWRVKGFQLSLITSVSLFFGETWFLLFAFINSQFNPIVTHGAHHYTWVQFQSARRSSSHQCSS